MNPFLFFAGAGALTAGAYYAGKRLFFGNDPDEKPERAAPVEFPPDLPAAEAGRTRWKGVNAIFSDLERAARASGIPLGVLVGWVAKESAGRIGAAPKVKLKGESDVERGFFQLTPSESKSLGLDHARLSTDPAYSLDAGVRLIREKYAPRAEKLAVAPLGSSYFWRLVKLGHTMGSGAAAKIIAGAKAAGTAGTWEQLRNHAVSENERYLRETKHSPKKWFPLVDAVYEVGRPFGFGAGDAVAGEDAPPAPADGAAGDLEALARMLETEFGKRTAEEREMAAWAIRNRAALFGKTVREILAPWGAYGSRETSGGYASTRKLPAPETRAEAARVLAAASDSDPSGGAVAFWSPGIQDQMKALGDLARAAREAGDEEKFAKYARFLDFDEGEDEVRERHRAVGLRVARVTGGLELLAPAKRERR